MKVLVKAAVMEKPGMIVVKHFPKPNVPSDAILLKVHMAGVCASDLSLYRGHAMPGEYGAFSFPIIPGHEIVGIIEELGKEANQYMLLDEPVAEGDRVLLSPGMVCGRCWGCRHFGNANRLDCSNLFVYGLANCSRPPHLVGGYAERLYLKPGSRFWKLPADMSSAVAVLADPLSTCIRAVERVLSLGSLANNTLLPFQGTVVVQGSGGIGLLTAAALRIIGVEKIIMTGGPANRLRLAEELGLVDKTINIFEVNVQNRISSIRSMTPGRMGADAVFQCSGSPEAFVEALKMARASGAVVDIGNWADAGRNVGINASADVTFKDITIMGVNGPSAMTFEKAFHMLKSTRQRFQYDKLVTHKFGIDEVEMALQALEKQECLKAVIMPNGIKE